MRTKHVTSPNHMSPPALLRPPLPYEVMHAYLPAQEKMAEMVHSPISTLLYFIDHTNLLTVWSALLLECKVRARPGVLFRPQRCRCLTVVRSWSSAARWSA